MPWKTSEAEEQRAKFIKERLTGRSSMAELCRRFGISRNCGHKWWRRFCLAGRAGLAARGRASAKAAGLRRRWDERVRRLRRAHPQWGAPKLQWGLRQKYRPGPWPSVSTIGRWLRQAGLTRRRPARAVRGPRLLLPRSHPADRPNAVWTIDFKGSFYTGDRRRVSPLTVRDLATRCILAARHIRPAEAAVARLLQRLFKRHGRPQVIRTDNGPPFGSLGPRGWTPLTLRWVRQGIRVEFSRPACPQDNAGHEQMHGILKRATAQPPAANPAAQQRRIDRWRQEYNHRRPHAALGMQPPAKLYAAGPGRAASIPAWTYPPSCTLTRLDARGRQRWGGRARHIGRAFARQVVGLRARTANLAEVYFGPHLLGTLHRSDLAGLRPVQWRPTQRGKGRGLRPLP